MPQLIAEYTETLKETTRYLTFVRAIELQKAEIDRLTKFKQRIRAFKYGAIQAEDEKAANALFHMQCVLNAHISVLTLWTHLKAGENQKAWGSLIDAEEYLSVALRADEQGTGVEKMMQFLRQVETVIFPGFPIYNSIGAVIRGGVCTACGEEFHTCGHVEGRVYWGKLCVRVNYEVLEVDHSAIVKQPRDRRCIVTEITSSDGIRRDYITWAPLATGKKLDAGTIGSMSGVLFSFSLIEVT